MHRGIIIWSVSLHYHWEPFSPFFYIVIPPDLFIQFAYCSFFSIIQYLTSCPLQINKERVGWLVSLLAFRNILHILLPNHIFVSPTASELGWCQLNRIWAQGRPSSVCELFADSFLSGASILSILVQSSTHISWGYYIQSYVIHSKFWGWTQGRSTFN